MSIEKISFTSSILGDMAAKAASFQDNKQPVQTSPIEEKQQQTVAQTEKQEPQIVVSNPVDTITDKSKNKVKRNTIIGLGAAVVLISLGIAGRKGKLGPKLQKFLGGAERAAEKKGDDVADISSRTINTAEHVRNEIPVQPEIKSPVNPTIETVSPIADIKTFRIEPVNTKVIWSRFDKDTRKEIERINSIIDRNVPLIDDSLKTISVPTKKECMAIIEKDVNIKAIKHSDCMIAEDGTIFYDLFKDRYKIQVVFNPDKSFKSFTKFDTKNDYKTITQIGFGEGKKYDYYDGISDISLICNEDGKMVWFYRNITPNISLHYNNNMQLKVVHNNISTNPTKTVNDIHYENGKISRVIYYDTKTNRPVKMERLDDTGRIVYEKYEINGKDIEIDV